MSDVRVSTFKKAIYANNDKVADDLILKQFKDSFELLWRDGKTGKVSKVDAKFEEESGLH